MILIFSQTGSENSTEFASGFLKEKTRGKNQYNQQYLTTTPPLPST
jgi:hypothetical protein